MDEILKFKAPKKYIRDMLSLSEDAHDFFEDNEGVNQVPCALTKKKLQELKSADDSVWIINASTLDILGNDPQELIQCTEPGDRVAFRLTGEHKFKRTLEILHQLEFFTESPGGKGGGNDTGHTAIFTCPDSSPFLKVRSDGFNASGFVMQNCTESSGEGAIVVESQSKVVFKSTEFINNRNRAIFVASNAGLELKDCHFENNGNQNNDGGAIRILSYVSLSIRSSSFSGNNGHYGGAVYGNNRVAVTILFSNLSRNYAKHEGGAIYINNNINLSLIHTTLLGNNARSYGGAISGYHNITLTIINTNLVGNNAEGSGGVIDLYNNNNVTIINTALIENNARNGGAICLYDNNNVTIVNTTLTRNNARNGGAICLYDNNNLTIVKTALTWNGASYGGAIWLRVMNHVTIMSSMLTRNNAENNGGAISLIIFNILNVSNTVFSKNRAKYDGGAISLNNRNYLSLMHTTLAENYASRDGGAILSKDANTLELFHTNLSRNNASQDGGALRIYNSNHLILLNTTLSQNNAKKDGGGMRLSEKNNLTMVNSTMCENKAKEAGGALNVGSLCSIGITTSILLGNSANQGGAIFSGAKSVLSINQTKFEKNKATFGGCFYGESMSLEVQGCACQENSALTNGGCFHLGSSNATFKGSEVLSNHVENSGGGIYAFDESLLHTWNSSLISNSASRGGGIALLNGSRILCVNCSFENNSANQGGGLYVISNASRFLLVQLTMSIFRGNKASIYGGGIVVKTFGIKEYDCRNLSTPCDRIALDGTRFVNNSATFFGSIIVATKPGNIIIGCEERRTVTHGLMDEKMIGMLWNQSILKAIDAQKLCKSWEDGGHMNDTCKVSIGTFANKFNLTTNSTHGLKVEGNHSIGFIFKNVQSGGPLPSIRIMSIDAFGNRYAPFLMEGITLRLDSSEGSREQEVRCSLENGTCTIDNLIGFVLRENYTIQFNSKDDDILEATNLRIIVSGCIVDAESASDGKICRECGDASYNFDLSSSGKCVPCPENANCSTRYIKPKDGYWHKSPCHARVKKCITEDACKVQDRTHKLRHLTRGFDDCNLTNEVLSNYSKTQCHEGYKGPLCGSCKEYYGLSSSFKCLKCGPIIMSILTLIGIATYLMFGTAITIKGVLPMRSTQRTNEDTEAPLIEVDTSTLEGTSITQPSEAIQENNGPSQTDNSQEPTSPSNAMEQLKHEIEIAKQKMIETWKVLLNFFQVTSTAATMDVKWTNEVLGTMDKLRVFGAATVNSISRPMDCLLSLASRATRVIWRTLFSIFIPASVILILALYWGYRAIMVHERDESYFLKRLLLTVVTTIYITYFDMNQVAVRVFNCVVVYNSTDPFSKLFARFWIEDTSIECYKDTHLVLIGSALVILMMVSIGFPFFCSFALLAKKDDLTTTNSWAHETLSFLCGPFKEKFVYWECVTMIKKALLSIIIVFSYSLGNQAQGLLILMVLGFFLYLHQLCNPYDEAFNSLNYFEGGSLWASCTVYTLVQFLNVGTLSEFGRHAVSVCLIGTVGSFVCIMVYKIFGNIIHLLKIVLESKNVQVSKRAKWFAILKTWYDNRRLLSSTQT